ncbi:beta-ketoacyl synthase N-terminal-like domain-containing protein [Streptomyces sp. NPDC004629]|uniref:beta-ketoacyl synthase N-terminal-like domain-containing protein n=1 Tax=Streptomyces sp. NPDC004629 TaxID=3364705 RepID=UPI00369EC392
MRSFPVSRLRTELVISGIGMITPAGCGSTANWRTVCAGLPTAARTAQLAGQRVDFACTVPADFDGHEVIGDHARRMARFTQFAVAAARQAVRDAGLGPGRWDAARVGVVLGTAFGGIDVWQDQAYRLRDRGSRWMSPLTVPLGLANMAAGAVAMDLGLHGPGLVVSTACASVRGTSFTPSRARSSSSATTSRSCTRLTGAPPHARAAQPGRRRRPSVSSSTLSA